MHTHFMPANVMTKVWAYFDNVGAARGGDWPIRYRQSEEERLALLRAFGVRRFSALNYPHKPGMAAWLNGWSAEFAARTPDALLPRLAGLRGKILLGSDFPNIPHPYAHQLRALARLGLGEPWLRAVCHDNAAALLGL